MQTPKYQAIHAVLRERILSGEYPPGAQLPPQQELADSFDVTLMTLRQAVAALESDGLVWAARGKGTFVVDRPVDLRLDHLSSFAAQMRASGVRVETEVLEVGRWVADAASEAAVALGESGDLTCVTRRRSVGGVPIALQRSWFGAGLLAIETPADLGDASLYDAIEAATGRAVATAREAISAVLLAADDAERLSAGEGQPAILSVRTSIDDTGRPFLWDRALLVGNRCTITADRTSDRLSLRYGMDAG